MFRKILLGGLILVVGLVAVAGGLWFSNAPPTVPPIATSGIADLATAPAAGASALAGTIWQVEDIDQGGVIDFAMLTLEFTTEGGIVGFTGCNRFFGGVSIDGDAIRTAGIGSTRRACVDAVMNQEQRFLAALGDIVRYRIDADIWLLLLDENGVQRLKLIGIESDPTVNGRPGVASPGP